MKRSEQVQLIRHKLASQQASIGSWIQIPHSSVAEIMGASGYDWAAIDMEHGSIARHQLPDLCRALELRGTLPLVRLAEGTAKEAKSALDAGAGGVIVPMIKSLEELLHIIDVSRWPPSGHRGVGFSRANLFGAEFETYMEEAQSPLIAAMIENREALQNLGEIVQASGLDALMIGPYDLSASLGVVGQFNHPIYESALDQIKRTAGEAGIPLGLHVVEPTPSLLRSAVSDGFLFCAYGIDSVFLLRSASKPPIHQDQ
jgi:2-dehydro-3-deoxyglucarate aldolase